MYPITQSAGWAGFDGRFVRCRNRTVGSVTQSQNARAWTANLFAAGIGAVGSVTQSAERAGVGGRIIRGRHQAVNGVTQNAGRAGLDGWKEVAIIAGAALALLSALALGMIWWLIRREPYATFYRLTLRAKLKFLRLLVLDLRIPWYIRALPLIVLIYWLSPIDLIPLIPVDDIAIALLTLALMVWLTPRPLITELLNTADAAHPITPPTTPKSPPPKGEG